ncbi:MAG: DsbC family protein [Burkholderiaceae bacterium]
MWQQLTWKFVAAAWLAALAATAQADDAAVRATLERTFPQNPIQGIAKTPVPGLVEAAIGGRVVYVTEDGLFILGGPLIDVNAKRNLSDARLEQINAIPFDSLNLEWAIKIVKGKGTRKVAIFEDPDCPYCRALEKAMRDVDDLTVYVFLYPIDQLHPEASAKSRAVWCASDPAKAWTEVMRSGTVPTGAATCANPLAKIAAFAIQHRINGTPTTILSDGRRMVGAVPREQLEARLQGAARP